MNCKLCKEDYNYILQEGYCVGCGKALRAQQGHFQEQMLPKSGGTTQGQYPNQSPMAYN